MAVTVVSSSILLTVYGAGDSVMNDALWSCGGMDTRKAPKHQNKWWHVSKAQRMQKSGALDVFLFLPAGNQSQGLASLD